MLELLELRPGAAKPDLARRAVDEVERDEPTKVTPVLTVPWIVMMASAAVNVSSCSSPIVDPSIV